MKKQAKTKAQRGFTLLETSVALVVMMIGALGVAAVFSYAVHNNTGGRDRISALAVAQQQMELLRNLPFNDAALNATATNPAAVTVTNGGRTYAVRTTIQNTTTTLKTIQIQVTPTLNGDPWAGTSVQITAQRASFALGPYIGGL